MALQLLGVLIVFWGIQETRKLFGRPSLALMLRQWFQRRPRFRPQIFEVSANAAGLSSAGARPSIYEGINPNAPLEQRVQSLERNIKYLQDEIATTQKELEQGIKQVVSSLYEEQKSRLAEDQKISSRVEATETGGLHISAIGAIWIFFGIIVSSLPNELSAWLG